MLVEGRRVDGRIPAFGLELVEDDVRPRGEIIVEQVPHLGEPVVVFGPRLGDFGVAPAGGFRDDRQIDGVLAGRRSSA